MLLFTSLRNTGLSDGNNSITFWTGANVFDIIMKNRAPLMFCIPLASPVMFPNGKTTKIADKTVPAILAYEAWGSLNIFLRFLSPMS